VFTAAWSFQLDRARTMLDRLDRDWSERDEFVKAQVLWWRALTELRAGRLQLAAEHAERAREIRDEYRVEKGGEREGDWLTALIAAHRGDLERARD